jgi:hypothetical protein
MRAVISTHSLSGIGGAAASVASCDGSARLFRVLRHSLICLGPDREFPSARPAKKDKPLRCIGIAADIPKKPVPSLL